MEADGEEAEEGVDLEVEGVEADAQAEEVQVEDGSSLPTCGFGTKKNVISLEPVGFRKVLTIFFR